MNASAKNIISRTNGTANLAPPIGKELTQRVLGAVVGKAAMTVESWNHSGGKKTTKIPMSNPHSFILEVRY